MTDREERLETLRIIQERLEEAERVVHDFRERKWDLVRELKEDGYDFTATTEGMDIVLSSSPSFICLLFVVVVVIGVNYGRRL